MGIASLDPSYGVLAPQSGAIEGLIIVTANDPGVRLDHLLLWFNA
jgi:hypothetical protein